MDTLGRGSELPLAANSGGSLPEKFGGCPPDDGPCLLSVPDHCMDDSQCPARMKCCYKSCFRQCVHKISGKCPSPPCGGPPSPEPRGWAKAGLSQAPVLQSSPAAAPRTACAASAPYSIYVTRTPTARALLGAVWARAAVTAAALREVRPCACVAGSFPLSPPTHHPLRCSSSSVSLTGYPPSQRPGGVHTRTGEEGGVGGVPVRTMEEPGTLYSLAALTVSPGPQP